MADKDIKTLYCNVCSLEKSINCFSPRKDRSRGYHYLCKECQASKVRLKRKMVLITEEQKLYSVLKSREWRKNNPAHRNALKAKYKSAKNQASPNWLNKEQLDKIISFYELAIECQSLTGDEYQVDHIIPIRGKNVCGLHVPWNLQVLPADLNRRKSNNV